MSADTSTKHLFDKATLGTIPLKNRLIRSATWEGVADEEGHIPPVLYSIYEGLAQGGVGCIITGFTSVSDNDHMFEGIVRISNDGLIEQHKKLTEIVHKHDCPIFVQLAMGEYCKRNALGNLTIAPIDRLTTQDIEDIRKQFVDAAVRAQAAGYDGVQIHVAHNFFLSRFVSPVYNHRTADYRADGDHPGQLIAEIITGVHAAAPRLHVSMKINCSDFIPRGLDPTRSMAICKECVSAGVNSIEVSGNGTSRTRIIAGVNEAYFKGFALDLAKEVPVPVILVGGHRSVANMLQVLNEGQIAFLSLSRPLIREPDLPHRWESGDTSPSACVSCNGCYSSPAHRCVFELRKLIN